MKILGLLGNSGAGKDTLADYLVKEYRFVKVGLADPLKRICKEVYGFSDEQLWGPSEKRNEPDWRYPRSARAIGDPAETKEWLLGLRETSEPKAWLRFAAEHFLTPRFALQALGTEWGRNCYNNTWIDYGIRVAKELLFGYARYTAKDGLILTEKDVGICPGVVISDCRFRNEFDAIKKVSGMMVRIKRPGYHGSVGIAGHASEEEQKTLPDNIFDWIVTNDGTIGDMFVFADKVFVPQLESRR